MLLNKRSCDVGRVRRNSSSLSVNSQAPGYRNGLAHVWSARSPARNSGWTRDPRLLRATLPMSRSRPWPRRFPCCVRRC